MKDTMTIYSVLHYDESSPGVAGDCTHIARFRRQKEAAAFAEGKTCYGKPAGVEKEEVPTRIARRWAVR